MNEMSGQKESEGQRAEPREWTLDAETEYRFELDPGTSLAIKVCLHLSFAAEPP